MKNLIHMASFHNHTKYLNGGFAAEQLVNKAHEFNKDLTERKAGPCPSTPDPRSFPMAHYKIPRRG